MTTDPIRIFITFRRDNNKEPRVKGL
jgi:hypothetical protein